MRHLGSILLSIILAPVIYVLASVGMVRLATNGAITAGGGATNWNDVLVGAGSIVVAGALYAILVQTRLSPLGPLVAALGYIAAQLWALEDQSSLVKLIGDSVFGTKQAAEAPLTGLSLLLAIPLLATIVSPRRWRGKPTTVAYVAPAPAVHSTTQEPTFAPADEDQTVVAEPEEKTEAFVPEQTTAANADDADKTISE